MLVQFVHCCSQPTRGIGEEIVRSARQFVKPLLGCLLIIAEVLLDLHEQFPSSVFHSSENLLIVLHAPHDHLKTVYLRSGQLCHMLYRFGSLLDGFRRTLLLL